MTRWRALVCALAAVFPCQGNAADLPEFATDIVADRWLREASATYRQMASTVDSRTGYTIRGADCAWRGNVIWEGGKPVILLDGKLAGPGRVSILIFELTNCFQAPRHQEIDHGAAEASITSPIEFGLLHELVELDGLRMHRTVLEELNSKLGTVPAAMLHQFNPSADKLGDYQIPLAFDFVKSERSSGHTKHYWDWFPVQAWNAPEPLSK